MDLTDRIFTDPDAAREHLEVTRWPDGPVCPHCQSVDQSTGLKGKAHRKGVYQCNACREQFTVTVGTVFEKSKIGLNKWLLATYLLSAGKKGVSAHQLHRTLGVTYKTAWFMAHRIREAMVPTETPPLGTGGGAVEVDETFIGRVPGKEKPRGGSSHMNRVMTLVDRDTGTARSKVMTDFSMKAVGPIMEANISREARLMTDEYPMYKAIGWNFADHGVVTHSRGEYVSMQDRSIHTNTIEGFFSVFKRGMRGVYQHCSAHHLQRYVTEFDFRYTNRIATGCNDAERADRVLVGIGGKRLTYRRTDGLRAA